MLRALLPVALACCALSPRAAPAQVLSRADRLAALSSNQVVFDRRGEPLVSVRLTEHQTQVSFASSGRLALLPGGDEGARVTAPARARWVVTLEEATPGQTRYWVAVARVPASRFEDVAAARARWEAAGHVVQVFESGALLGLAGKTLDTRILTVAADPLPDEAAARAHAAALRAGGDDVLDELVAEPTRPPTGWLVAREARSGIEVRARDLLWVSPLDEATVSFDDLEWGHGTPRQGRAARSYAGDVYLTVGRDGRLVVANLLSAERLLEGVVPSEIPPSAPAAALRAQAVAARGQLLAKVGTRHRADPYLLCAETHCQVYTGATRTNARTTAAVRATRGELLFDADGLVDTVYSSACGGHSESFDAMWGGGPHPALPGLEDRPGAALTPVTAETLAELIDHPPADAWCAATADKAGVFRWTKRRTAAQIGQGLTPFGAVGPLRSVRALRRGVSGRALDVEYLGDAGRVVVSGSYLNRTLLGGLRSGLWLATPEGPADHPAAWVFRGAGFGHGVGLCQHGAMGQAAAGRTHAQILTHYYPGSHLERAW